MTSDTNRGHCTIFTCIRLACIGALCSRVKPPLIDEAVHVGLQLFDLDRQGARLLRVADATASRLGATCRQEEPTAGRY